jgi:hypothetical protein
MAILQVQKYAQVKGIKILELVIYAFSPFYRQ